MIDSDMDNFEVLAGSLKGERAVDEQTFVSLSILQERLESLHSSGDDFSDIDFSPEVKELMNRKKASLVC